MPPVPENPELTHARLIGARFRLHAYVRYGVAAGIILGTLVLKRLLRWQGLDEPVIYAVAAFMLVYNTVSLLLYLRRKPTQAMHATRRWLIAVTYTMMVLDYLCLTVAVWAIGGSRSPFLVFYLFHVIFACLLFSRRMAVISTLLAWVLLAGLVVGEWAGYIPPRMPLGAIAAFPLPDGPQVLILLTVYGVLLGLTTFLLTGMSQEMRSGEQRLLNQSAERERLSSLRRDFLRLASHNLRSPVGAASVLLSNLRDGLAGPLNDQQAEWVARSLFRLEGLSEFLRDLQMLAELQSGSVMQHASGIAPAALLESIVEEHRDIAAELGHHLDLELENDLRAVQGIERLLHEAVANYLRNAIRYTPQGGHIVVRATCDGPELRIEVQDDGVGIAREDQERLFRDFVRLGQGQKETPGTGLGLSIVRRIVEMHGGKTGVRSTQGKGSTFYITLPTLPAGDSGSS